MKIDRWNCGETRRYHLPSGAIVVVHKTVYGRITALIPAAIHHISVRVNWKIALKHLRDAREDERRMRMAP